MEDNPTISRLRKKVNKDDENKKANLSRPKNSQSKKPKPTRSMLQLKKKKRNSPTEEACSNLPTKSGGRAFPETEHSGQYFVF
ncbi:hypothetical protein JCM33374_g879 [Metschnikowia sp. JCM 33374]|nr:hypothetical protein JCM33374_g879 [Metschnikowia sp. JCM 33374]